MSAALLVNRNVGTTTPPVKEPVKQEAFLDLPHEMREKYMMEVFRNGPNSLRARAIRDEYAGHEKAALFIQFANATDDLKKLVGGTGMEEGEKTNG